MKAINLIPILFITIWGGELYYYQNGKRVYIDNLKVKRDGQSATFKQNFNDKTILNYILLKPKNDASLQKIQSMNELKFIEKIGVIYKFEVNSAIIALELSAKLYEENLTTFSHPDFIQKKEKRVISLTETGFLNTNYSWHIKAINADEAWNYSKGEGIKVAVFDDGMDYLHEDLNDNYLFGYNFDDSNKNVYPTNSSSGSGSDYHGTAVAGAIGAEENSIGVIGVAPKSYLIGIKQIYESDSLTIKAFDWAKENSIDVINCSWGTYNVSDAVKASIVDLATNGRYGKGALIVFAIGNEDISMDNDDINDESEIEEVIAVGATDHFDQRSSFSNYGSALDIVAPGGYFEYSRSNDLGISSTDISGSGGVSDGDYILSTSAELIGTSFSAPIVAGVIADILAINPNLTRDEVKDILYSTAQKVGDIAYRSQNNYTFNEKYGYGLIDTEGAVKKAFETHFKMEIKKGWNLLGNVNSAPLSTNELFNNFADSIYAYNDEWQTNPSIVGINRGFWVKSIKDTTFTFSNTNFIEAPTISNNWQLFSATKNLRISGDNLYYVYRSDGWHEYPDGDLDIIYKGEGYWVREVN